MSRQSYFTEQLNYYLKKKGVSKGALAAALGCLPSIVEAWLKGERYPDDRILKEITAYLCIPEDSFVEKKETSEEAEENGRVKKMIAVGHCARCGKPIYQDDKYGMGTVNRRVKFEFLKEPIEETVYEYNPDSSGYDYFCKACCDYLIEEEKLNLEKKNKSDLRHKKKIKNKSFLLGFLTFLIGFVVSFAIVWNPFKWFPWSLETPHKMLIIPASILLGYYVFSFVFVTMSGNNFVGKGIRSMAKVLYVDSLSGVYKSNNSVLHMFSVKAMVGITIVLVCTIIFLPIALFFGIFAMFAWPHSANVLHKDIKRLSKIV